MKSSETHGSHLFSTVLSEMLGIERSAAAGLYATVSKRFPNTGSGANDGTQDTLEQVKNGLCRTIAREAVRDWGRLVAVAVLGGLAVVALPEEALWGLGAIVVFLVIKSYSSTYADFKQWVENTLTSVFADIRKGIFSSPNSDE